MAHRLVLIRHGETAWSITGRHTGRTDLELTERGRAAAAGLQPVLAQHRFSAVMVSPLRRARETAELAGLTGTVNSTLMEWDYGGYEGRRTAEIREQLDDDTWTIWSARIPPGETPGEELAAVGARADSVLAGVGAIPGDTVLVAHGHFLRILTARWLGLPPDGGQLFALDPGRISVLGFEHETRVILSWNARQLAVSDPGSSHQGDRVST